MMDRLIGIARFLLTNFGPMIAFYTVNAWLGPRVAIGTAMAVTIVEVLRFRARGERPTTFFTFSAAIALVFGSLDLMMSEPLFFKFEATLTNLMFACFFGMSLVRPKSIIEELAEQEGRIHRDSSQDKTFFFRVLTTIWVAYFVAKAAAYLWINLNQAIEQALLIRIIVGKVSLMALMAFSIGLARPFWKLLLRLRLMPSTRG